jgi:hypothetical protein
MLQTKRFSDLEKSLAIIGLIENVKFLACQSNAPDAVGTFYTLTALN